MIVFTTDSKDGAIFKSNTLNIYFIGYGLMGYGYFGIFTYEIRDIITRKAEYCACDGESSMDCVDSLDSIIAYG